MQDICNARNAVNPTTATTREYFIWEYNIITKYLHTPIIILYGRRGRAMKKNS